jgi:hypothetical protein
VDTIETRKLPHAVRVAVQSTSRKKTVRAKVRDGAIETHGTWWDGGSKAEYWLLELATGRIERVSCPTNPFKGEYSTTIQPKAGWCVMSGGTFCGKPSQPCLTVWTWGDEQLGQLQLSYLAGDCPWSIVNDKMQELGVGLMLGVDHAGTT